jgi:hypothetical protein
MKCSPLPMYQATKDVIAQALMPLPKATINVILRNLIKCCEILTL